MGKRQKALKLVSAELKKPKSLLQLTATELWLENIILERKGKRIKFGKRTRRAMKLVNELEKAGLRLSWPEVSKATTAAQREIDKKIKKNQKTPCKK